MSMNSGTVPPKYDDSVTIPFRNKTRDQEEFLALFREGMGLVEAAANYLDGPGRRESKCLPPYISLSYATESMRLTTRLTQLATWLLARRAVMNGETMPRTGSANDPLTLPPISRMNGARGFEKLPNSLKELIEAGHQLHKKICDFDARDRGELRPERVRRQNPVAAQLARLNAAFAH